MRMQIHIPIRYASMWDPTPGFVTFTQFQKRLAEASGGFTVTQAGSYFPGGAEPVMIVEALVTVGCTMGSCHAYADVWALFREYAHQLLNLGEERVLIVQDNEPTWVTHPRPPAPMPDPFESLDTSEREARWIGRA